MEILTDLQLRLLAEGVAKLAFVAGLAGALTALGILKGIYAVAEFLAERTVKAARVHAARYRATAASVAVAAPVASESVNPLGFYCPENGLYHAWDGDICVTCGAHAPLESLR